MKLVERLNLLVQFGLSLITPLLLCLFLCMLLNNRLGVGLWVYIPGFFFGLGGSATFAYKLYLSLLKKQEKEHRPVAFNQHE